MFSVDSDVVGDLQQTNQGSILKRQVDVTCLSESVCVCVSDDHSRITLKVESSQSTSDYINASPIVSSSSAF